MREIRTPFRATVVLALAQALALTLVATPAISQKSRPEREMAGAQSNADMWRSRSDSFKASYLDGVCEGFGASPDLVHLSGLTCEGLNEPHSISRFCLVAVSQRHRAVSIIDTFYEYLDKSEIPVWALIAAYNDKE